jgi:hypothetical protein
VSRDLDCAQLFFIGDRRFSVTESPINDEIRPPGAIYLIITLSLYVAV